MGNDGHAVLAGATVLGAGFTAFQVYRLTCREILLRVGAGLLGVIKGIDVGLVAIREEYQAVLARDRQKQRAAFLPQTEGNR